MSEREKTETGGSRKTAAEKAEEMTSAFSKDQQQLLPPHPFPHKSRRRMMIQQLSLQPLLLQPQLLLHPHPVLHPESQPHPQSHPQLVAAKSLIDKSSSKFYLHFIIWQESVHSYKKVDSVYSLRYNKRNVTFL